MSLIEEALRRVQELTPPAAPINRTAAVTATATEEAPAVLAPAPIPVSRSAPPRPQESSIPPATPSPITIGGLGLTAVSVAVLIAVSAVTLRHSSARSPRATVPAAPALIAAAPTAELAAPEAAALVAPPVAQAPELQAAKPVSSGDPMTAVPRENPFTLNGVVRGGNGDSVAMINGRIVKIGEMIEGATLVEVMPDAARLRWPDREVIIRMTR